MKASARAWSVASCMTLLVPCGCDGGPQTLGWEGASQTAPTAVPWFGGPAYYGQWPRGLPADSSFFPIGVWMQNPINAERFKAVGVNHYVGLWQGPTEEQLAGMVAAGVPAVCEQAGVWQDHLDSATIQGWLQADGPDNAQENPDGSYSPCIAPAVTQARYAEMVAADPTRPVTLLLGQGVATPDWVGRGDCTGQTEDYFGYAQGSDILVNYTYPLSNDRPLELVATGIDNLNRYAGYAKPVMADLEASNIYGTARPTPHQLRAEVWMSLVHGAAGVQWYCHRFMPDFSETDCLDDAGTAAALAQINAQLSLLAPVLNTQSFSLTPLSANADVPVDAVLKQHGAERYVFAVSMADGATTARFPLAGLRAPTSIEVIGEGRNLAPTPGDDSYFEDAFAAYEVHLYHLH
jgi:hypothetical protein